MRLDELRARDAVGLPDELRVELGSSDVVLVHGPNGVGKSSLVRLARSFLWPDRRDTLTRATSRWSTADGALAAQLQGGAVSWSREGRPCEAPHLPGEALAPSYHLGLRSLLTESEDGFADRMRLELYRGIRIEEVEQARESSRRLKGELRKANRALQEAGKQVSAAEQELGAGEEDERRLRALERRIAREGDDQRALDALRAERERRRDARHAQSLREELARYPAAMETLRARDSALAKDQEQELDRRRTELEAAKKNLALAEEALAQLGSTPAWEEAAAAGTLPELGELRERLRCFESAAQREEQEAQAARIAAAEAGLESVEEALALPEEEHERSTLGALERVLREHTSNRDLLDAARMELDALPADEDAERLPSDSDLEQGIELLRRWLRTPEPAPAAADRGRTAGVVLLVLGAVACALGALGGAVLLGTGVGLALSGVVLLLLARGRSSEAPRAGERARVERQVANLPLDPPAPFVEERVTAALAGLEKTLEHRRREAAERQQHAAARAKAEARVRRLEEKLRESGRRREELLATVGLAPDTTLDAADALRGLEERRTRRSEARRAACVAREARDARDSCWEELRAALTPHGIAPAPVPQDAHAVKRALKRLEQRTKAFEEVCSSRRLLEDQRSRLEESEERCEQFYRERGLEDEPPGGRLRRLEEWVNALPEWSELRDQHTAVARKLGAGAPPREELAELSDEDLERRVRSLEAELEALGAVRTEIGELRGKLDRLRSSAALEDALAEDRDARARIEDLEHRLRLALCRERLLRELRDELETKHAPALLGRADALLRRFTANQNGLRFDRERGFLGYDVVAGELRTLEELSDGTRVQCLLAIRLGTIEADEPGAPLPLFLDEALVNADQSRERAVIDALLSLTGPEAGGRQVVYLTAQPSDVAVWKRRAAEAGRTVRVVDLGELVRGERAATGEDLLFPAAPPLPAPEPGESLADYGARLHVRPLLVRAPAEGLDLFHLLRPDEVELLHRSRRRELTTLGLLQRDADPATTLGVDAARAEELLQRAHAYTLFRELWLRGRPPRLTARDLAGCGAVSDKFRGRVLDLLRELDGDAAALLAAIEDGRLARFQASKLEELRAWLEEGEWLPCEAPLSPAERRRHLAQALGVQGDASFERIRELDAMWAARAARAEPSSAAAEPTGAR